VVREVLGGLEPDVPHLWYVRVVKSDGSCVHARTLARNGGLELGTDDPRRIGGYMRA
jgi:hypothetical protein